MSGANPFRCWRDGAVRLIDFGVPDFTRVQSARYAAAGLTFFAVDMYMGVPYRVALPDLRVAPAYAPLPLTPLPDAVQQAAASELTP